MNKTKKDLVYIVLENRTIFNQYAITKVFDSFEKAEKYLLDLGYKKYKSIYRNLKDIIMHAMILEKGVE